MPDKFEKFTEQARTVFSLAQEEAARFNHNYIGTEHILLGLVKEGEGVAARVLANLGVSLPKVRSAVEFIIGRGDGLVVGEPSLTPRTKKVIELAMDEARQLQSSTIGTEHLLLGIIREGGGIAAGVLESLGVGLERVHRRVMQAITPSSPQSPITGDITYKIDIPSMEYTRLRRKARRLGRSIDELILEAVRRVWLTDDADQPPSPQASEGSV
jgi:ATP-dependent Clp protease ATP-binding subunit ClpA